MGERELRKEHIDRIESLRHIFKKFLERVFYRNCRFVIHSFVAASRFMMETNARLTRPPVPDRFRHPLGEAPRQTRRYLAVSEH